MRLRTVSPADFPLLFSWYCDFESNYVWHLDRRVRGFRQFSEMVVELAKTSELCLIEDGADQPIGCLLLYASRPSDGWSHLALYVCPEKRDLDTVRAAARAAVSRAFQLHATLRKLYVESYDFTPLSVHTYEELGFVAEGLTPAHLWFRDRFWAKRRLALYRQVWEAVGCREVS